MFIVFDFSITPPQPGTDILIACLSELAFAGFVETEKGLQAYIEESRLDRGRFQSLAPFRSAAFAISYTERKLPQQNWNARWERAYQPVCVAGQIYIHASFHPLCDTHPYSLHIEPKMSFGTGHHQTTCLMLDFLLHEPITGKRILDMGTGTGVLGIFALKRGARSVLGIDIDPWSRENAQENASRNGVVMELKTGDATLLDAAQKFDLILANIDRNTLLRDLRAYTRVINPGAKMVLSGFLQADSAGLTSRAAQLGLRCVGTEEQDDWARLIFQEISIFDAEAACYEFKVV